MHPRMIGMHNAEKKMQYCLWITSIVKYLSVKPYKSTAWHYQNTITNGTDSVLLIASGDYTAWQSGLWSRKIFLGFRLRLLTPTPAVLKNQLRLLTPTPAVLKNRLRLQQFWKTDSDSSSFKKPTPTPDSSSFKKPTPTPAVLKTRLRLQQF